MHQLARGHVLLRLRPRLSFWAVRGEISTAPRVRELPCWSDIPWRVAAADVLRLLQRWAVHFRSRVVRALRRGVVLRSERFFHLHVVPRRDLSTKFWSVELRELRCGHCGGRGGRLGVVNLRFVLNRPLFRIYGLVVVREVRRGEVLRRLGGDRMHELRSRNVPTSGWFDLMPSLRRGKLLRINWPNVDESVPCWELLRRRVDDFGLLRGGGLLGRLRQLVLELRGGLLPTELKLLGLPDLRCAHLLPHDWSKRGDGMPRWELLHGRVEHRGSLPSWHLLRGVGELVRGLRSGHLPVERRLHVMCELRGGDSLFVDWPVLCCSVPRWELLSRRHRTRGRLLCGLLLGDIIDQLLKLRRWNFSSLGWGLGVLRVSFRELLQHDRSHGRERRLCTGELLCGTRG
jgi:hypothetical protein